MASIRWKILLAFFLIVGISFFVAATSLTGLVSQYLFDQRKRDDSLKTEKLASVVSHYFQSVSANELNEELEENAAAMDGRLMLIDNDGKIQYDTFQSLCGQRVQVDEVLRVLAGEKEAYGIHSPGREAVETMSGEHGAEYVAYSAHEIEGFQGRIGAALYVGRVQKMMDDSCVVLRFFGIFITDVKACFVLFNYIFIRRRLMIIISLDLCTTYLLKEFNLFFVFNTFNNSFNPQRYDHLDKLSKNDPASFIVTKISHKLHIKLDGIKSDLLKD